MDTPNVKLYCAFAQTPKLKLYIVNEKSGNPEDWTELGPRALVLAESLEQAYEVAGDIEYGGICEVVASGPIILCHFGIRRSLI